MSHARLSPSAAKRWLNCTPSVLMEEQYEDSTSPAAAEGTAAHELAELLLRREINDVEPSFFKARLSEMKQGPYYSEAMAEYVSEYVSFVMERFAMAKVKCPDAKLVLETVVDLSGYIPEGYGTVDVHIITEPTLEIIDLKYGKGVLVEVENNDQLLCYGLGAYEHNSVLYYIREVAMTIYQPRMDNIATVIMKAEDLIEWGVKVLVPGAKLAYAGKGEFKTGEHCKFCRAKMACATYYNERKEAIEMLEFVAANTIKDEDVSYALSIAKETENWLNGIKEYALKEAVLKRKVWPGYKLVEGRSITVITNPVAAYNILIKEGYHTSDINKPTTLRGITDLRALVGTKKLDTLLKPVFKKPRGKPTLAPLSDKRQPMSSNASIDFLDELTEDQEYDW